MSQSERNGHYSLQKGHIERTTFHDAVKKAHSMRMVFSRGELNISTPNVEWIRKRYQKKVTNSGR